MDKGIFRSSSVLASGISLVLAAALTACGGGGTAAPVDNSTPPSGGGSTPPPDGGSGPALTAGVPGLVGEWLQNGCVAQGAESFKKFIRATEASSSRINYAEGVVTYAGTNCAGAGVRVGPSNLGTVTFSRSESNSTVAANWGQFDTIAGTKAAVIWAKTSANVLCLFGDSTPTAVPTLAAVAAIFNPVPPLGCFTKQ